MIKHLDKSKVRLPCIDCITKAMCRHKSYYELAKCPLLKELYGEIHFEIIDNTDAPHKPQKELLIEALNPTNWYMDDKGWVHEGSFVGHPGNDGVEIVQ